MPEVKPGDRVGAVCTYDDNKKEILLFGYGVFKGEEVPTEDIVGPFGIKPIDIQMKNPKIELDSGEVVWGCECWWGSEANIKEVETKSEIVNHISVKEYRKQLED